MKVVVANQKRRKEAAILARRTEGATFEDLVNRSQRLWVAVDEDEVVGYAGASVRGQNLHLTIAGVTQKARGQGLQRRFIKARLAWGKAQGATVAYTYANRRNRASLISLLHLGFSPYEVSNGFCYVAKYLT